MAIRQDNEPDQRGHPTLPGGEESSEMGGFIGVQVVEVETG